MRKTSALLGGLAGASALTAIHEVARKRDPEAPQMHKLGMKAVSEGFEAADTPPPSKKNVFLTSLAGEILANALFFSKVGSADARHPIVRGAMLGLGAGLTAVFLPKKAGIKAAATNRTDKTKTMTVAWYLIGGLVAGATALLIERMAGDERP